MTKQRWVTWAGREVSLLLLLVIGASQHALAQVSPEALFASASPAVVKLIIKDEFHEEFGSGSGFVVAFTQATGQCYWEPTVITNFHVIYPAVYVGALIGGKNGTGPALVRQVVIEDQLADIAVLTVCSSDAPERVLKLCEGAEPAIGTKVYTIGSPLGFTNTLSEGLVSGYRELDGARWMQISAPISPGSSGGPVLSIDGCVLGMTTATTKFGQNLNFAIPAKEIARFLNAQKKPRNIWEGASEIEAMKEALSKAISKMQEHCGDPAAVKPQLIAALGIGDAIKQLDDECLQFGVRDGNQLAILLAGYKLFSKKQYDDAVVMLKRAADAKHSEFAYLVYQYLGDAIKHTNQWPERDEQALPAWQKAKELRSDFAPTRSALAQAYKSLKRYPEALLEAESLVSLLPRCYEGYMLRGALWAELGRREAFERDFEQAVIFRPNMAFVYDNKGLGYEKLKDVDRAAEAYRQAIDIDGNDSLAHERLIRLYARAGQCAKAIEHYEGITQTIEAGITSTSVASMRESVNKEIQECRAKVGRLP